MDANIKIKKSREISPAKSIFRIEYRNKIAAEAKVERAQSYLDSRKSSLCCARLRLSQLGISENEAWADLWLPKKP